jgi:hypothetical protein
VCSQVRVGGTSNMRSIEREFKLLAVFIESGLRIDLRKALPSKGDVSRLRLRAPSSVETEIHFLFVCRILS